MKGQNESHDLCMKIRADNISFTLSSALPVSCFGGPFPETEWHNELHAKMRFPCCSQPLIVYRSMPSSMKMLCELA